MRIARGIDIRFFRSVWKLSRPFLVADSSWRARRLLATLLVLLLLVSAVNVLSSYIGRDFITALEQRHPSNMYHALWWYLGAFAIATILSAFYRYTEERLALRWREWMTQHLLKKYFANRVYYRLRQTKEIDNPDQRIAEDVNAFTATSLSLLLIVLNSSITVAAFTGVLYSISLSLVFTLLFYAAAGTIGAVIIGRRLVRLHYRQYRREADFRYGVIRIRDNAESIAFYRGEARERVDLARRFRAVTRNLTQLIRWNRNLAFFTNGYNYFALIVPTLIVAPLYLSGKVEFGVVTQSAGAFAQVLSAMSIIVTQFERLSAYAAGVGRLVGLWTALNAENLSDVDDDPEITTQEGERLALKNVTISPPDHPRVLIKDLNLRVKTGSGLLIMGASGRGKSSVLRVIAGLWQNGSGAVSRPQFRDMMFLPQRPYMPSGSLRAQLMYPSRERPGSDVDLTKVLRDVNLDIVLERAQGNFDLVLDWPNILSLGEQQRIAFARLFVKQPRLVCLDEATSALDEENETRLYEMLRASGMTFVSVGHRSTLKKFHDVLVTLEDAAKWSVTPIDEL